MNVIMTIIRLVGLTVIVFCLMAVIYGRYDLIESFKLYLFVFVVVYFMASMINIMVRLKSSFGSPRRGDPVGRSRKTSEPPSAPE